MAGGDAGSDASMLSCDSGFGFASPDIRAGEPFEVTFMDQLGHANVELVLTGPGAPQAAFLAVIGGPPFTWSFQVMGHGAGTLRLEFFRDRLAPDPGELVGACEVLVI